MPRDAVRLAQGFQYLQRCACDPAILICIPRSTNLRASNTCSTLC